MVPAVTLLYLETYYHDCLATEVKMNAEQSTDDDKFPLYSRHTHRKVANYEHL